MEQQFGGRYYSLGFAMIWNGDGPGQEQGPLRPDDVAPRQDAKDVPRVGGPVDRSVESGPPGMLTGDFRLRHQV